MDPDTLPANLASEISHVRGVSAVVLGGSRARGTHHSGSDIDLGIYYHPDQPLDLAALNLVAAHFDNEHRSSLLTPLGGWGPWINGGGWLNVGILPVDFLYRDLNKVGDIIQDCLQGQVEIAYQPGHPHGFTSSIYMGEVAICNLLWEGPERPLTTLKALCFPYPPALKKALFNKFAWEIDFSLAIAQKSISRADIVFASGACFRAAACLLQFLFALNECYWLNEKGAVSMAETFSLRPSNFQNRMESAFTTLSATSPSIDQAIEILSQLSNETNLLIQQDMPTN